MKYILIHADPDDMTETVSDESIRYLNKGDIVFVGGDARTVTWKSYNASVGKFTVFYT